jgi:hypothetical protein
MVEIIQHSYNGIVPAVFLTCRHNGEDDIFCHHTGVFVVRVEVAKHRFLGIFD